MGKKVRTRTGCGFGVDSGQIRVLQYNNTQWYQVGHIDGEVESDRFGRAGLLLSTPMGLSLLVVCLTTVRQEFEVLS